MKSFRRLAFCVVLALSSGAQASSLFIGGVEWYQVNELTAISVASHCDATTGACSGTETVRAELVDFNGWTWADTAAVRVMMEELIIPASLQFASRNNYTPRFGSDAIALAVGDLGFGATGSFAPIGEIVVGTLRNAGGPTSYAYLFNYFEPNDDNTYRDTAWVASPTAFPDFQLGSITGAWLYKSTPVPLPAAAWLLLSGAGVMLTFARHRRAAA